MDIITIKFYDRLNILSVISLRKINDVSHS